MKKKLLTAILTATMVLSMAACGNTTTTDAPAASTATTTKTETTTTAPAATVEATGGKVVNIYAWNEEFKGFFDAYYTASVPYLDADGDGTKETYYDAAPGKKYVDAGYTFNWVINPSDNGVYQDALDTALLAQADAADDDKVDFFLAEADYILKYVNADATTDVKAIGVTDFSNTYDYTVQACTDTNGVVKGVSFQCCPSALIYRRSIAKDVLGTDDPAAVQAALSDWTKFEAVAADAKAKGYYMTASFAETYRPFSNNVTSPWVDKDNKLQMDSQIQAWIAQTDKFIENGYTLTAGIWEGDKNDQMYATGKTMCFFGPAWYFNFCMGNAHDADKGCMGDWAIIEGPAAHFWGGTWILAAAGTDNADVVADVMNTFINNADVCEKLVVNESQFSNNKAVNAKIAADDELGASEFLGGQNATKIFSDMAGNIKFENQTIYDQILNEGLQANLQEFYRGSVDKETAMANFYKLVSEKYPTIVLP